MTLRTQLFQWASNSGPSLLRGGLISPRLPSLVRSNSNTSDPSNSPFLARSQPSPTRSTLGLASFLEDSLLSRARPAPTSAASATDDLLSLEFPLYTGSTFGATTGSLEDNMYRLCVFATKHNTHLTLTKPNKDIIVSLSCGNVGFKKAARGTFEAAYQLASVMFQKMEERNLRPRNLEIIFRDFGPGREAFTKVLLGKEGKGIRETVRRVTDDSRLKFGGTRSRAARRL